MIPRKHHFWSFLAIRIAVCQIQMILTLIPLQNEHDGIGICAVFLKCNNDNRAGTVLKCFVQATTSYFIPSRVRCDYGGENVEVAKFMLINRGFDRGSVLTGSSVHNQRIERLWRDVFQRVTGAFYKLFNKMEEIQILDSLNNIHLYCLHYFFAHAFKMHLIFTWLHGIIIQYPVKKT